jgi:hypothetical protein
MRLFSSILIVLGILISFGGVMALAVGGPSAVVRLVVGLALVGVAVAIRPKKTTATARRTRTRDLAHKG